MRKTQEVERLRFAVATVPSILFRIAAKLDDSRFVGVQFESEPRKPLAQFGQKPLCFLAMLKARNEVIGKTDENYIPVRLLLSPSVPTENSIVLKKRKRQARGDEICWVLDFCARTAGSTNKVPHKGRSADRLRR